MQSLVFSYSQRQYIKAARAGMDAANLQPQGRTRSRWLWMPPRTYIELDTVNRELEAAHQQEAFAGDLVKIEQQRAEAGVDSIARSAAGPLTAAQLKLKRLHLETRAGTLAKQLAVLTGLARRLDHCRTLQHSRDSRRDGG